jgi:hypothetical protein
MRQHIDPQSMTVQQTTPLGAVDGKQGLTSAGAAELAQSLIATTASSERGRSARTLAPDFGKPP